MKIIVYERMYSIHIIKLKLILLWFIETKKCMITLCGTGECRETMKLFTCSKWSTHACPHPYLCHENCEFVKSFVFWCSHGNSRKTMLGKETWESNVYVQKNYCFTLFNLHSHSVICIHNILSYEIYTIFKNVHI